ncbi:Archaemetzincin family protease [Halorhabdus sp. SVX81]|nr:Archaemetzincin family protease [Halorhabdus sp. SVX81]
MGDVSDRALESTADAVRTTLDVTPEISSRRIPKDELESAYDSSRERYEAVEAIEVLWNRIRADRWLVVTSVDLTHRRKNYVFGLALIDDGKAVLSTHRLGDEDDPALTDRVRKEAIKQVGRLFGARECDTEQCVFRATPTVGQLDRSGTEPCQECRTQLESIQDREQTAPDRDRDSEVSAPDAVPDVPSTAGGLDDGTATERNHGRSSHDSGVLGHELASIGRFWGSVLGFGISVVIGYFLLSTVGGLLLGTVELTEPLLFGSAVVNLALAWVIFRRLRTVPGRILEHVGR